MKVLAVYPGRFQPFHKGHAQVYQWLQKKYGNAVIATSNKVEAPKSPFNFEEKKKMMTLAGVPSEHIKQVSNPYVAKEILQDYDPKKTVLVFAVSQKDMEEDPRFSFAPTKSGKPSYLQPYKGNEKKLKPFGDPEKPIAYVVVTPTFTFDVLGKPATSASELRKQFVKLNHDKQKDFIKDLFGKYNASVHRLMDKKIGDMLGRPKTVKQLKEEISRDKFEDMLSSFVEFASEQLGLQSVPKIRYKTDEDDYRSFAAYNPSKNEMSIYTKDRHPMDIFRSVAHELVHHKQNEEDRITHTSKDGETGSPIENEANVMAGIIMRHFGHQHPDNFKLSYVTETNTAAMGGVRGMGYVTGETSPDGVSQYVLDNIEHTKSIQNSTLGLYSDKMKNWWMDQKTKDEYKAKTTKGFKAIRSQLTEGINDPGKLKAIFLAGGPGSGKDFVMNSALAGEGLREVNSDNAFEYLMKKHGLDMEMPEEEKIERDIVRGRAKNITKEQERLALAGRLGVIINGTADDLEKIKTIKKNLEADGYETMMVFVNTSNEVSRQRNVDRGKGGGRKVPDGTDKQGVPNGSEDIRTEKWELAQKNIGELQKVFGNDSFVVIDNSVDIRKATPEVKNKVLTDFSRVRRMAQQFVRAENQNPAAKRWIEAEAQKRGITYQEPKRYKTLTQVRQSVPQVVHKPDNELMAQARRLGLSYYGFGRFGRKVNGVNTVLYHSKGGKLIRVSTMNEEKKMDNPCWKGYKAYGMKKKNGKEVPNCVPVEEESLDKKFDDYMTDTHKRDFGTTSLRKLYASMTPGQESATQDQIKPVTFVSTALAEEKKKMKFVKKKLAQEDNNLPRSGLPQSGGIGPEITQYRPFTVTGFTGNLAGSFGLSESILSWANNPATQQKFVEKYGNLAEQRLNEAATRLEQCGCGMEIPKTKKSVAKIKETWPSAPHKSTYGDMGTVASTGKEELNERGEDSKGLYRPTEKGAGLTRKGAKHFGIKTAVTTPPSKLDPKGKAAKRRKSFCARMGGMKGPMKDEKGRPTRKAMSLRRWNCEE